MLDLARRVMDEVREYFMTLRANCLLFLSRQKGSTFARQPPLKRVLKIQGLLLYMAFLAYMIYSSFMNRKYFGNKESIEHGMFRPRPDFFCGVANMS